MPLPRSLIVLLVTTSVAAAAENGRPREYWTAIAESDYAVPEGAQPYELLVELNELLASPDPVFVKDVLRSTHTALAMDTDLAPSTEAAAAKLLEALGKMR